MKVTDIRRKLAASLVAGGLMMPVATQAAPLNTQLLNDPGFEDVAPCTSTFGCYLNNSWQDGIGSDYVYAVATGYANGTLAGGGLYFFNSQYATGVDGDVLEPGVVSQSVDVSTGDSAPLIASGNAKYIFSGFFSTYLSDTDAGRMHVDFLDSGGGSLGTNEIGPPGNLQEWTLFSGGGTVPVGTESIFVSLYGVLGQGGPDGYIDNVDLQITDVGNFGMNLEVNTVTGEAKIINDFGETVYIDYYEIVSAGDSLDPNSGTGWNSLQDQNLSGFPAGNGSGNGWEEAGGSRAGVLGESFLTGSSAVVDQAEISLGALYDPGDPQDLVFRYGALLGAVTNPEADFNENGIVDGTDLAIWEGNFSLTDTGDADNDSDTDGNDFLIWQGQLGDLAGPSGASTLVTGEIVYVPAAATAVPEPSSVVLVGIGLAALVAGRRKK